MKSMKGMKRDERARVRVRAVAPAPFFLHALHVLHGELAGCAPMRRLLPLVSLVVALTCAITTSAKVSSTRLEELTWVSQIVAVGRDVRVFEVEGWRIAEFKVDRVLKGDAGTSTLYYLADPTWTCDISTATPGEKSLLFLARVTTKEPENDFFIRYARPAPPLTSGDRPIYRVSHAGRGRMPIRTGGSSEESVRLMTADIELPDSLASKAFDVSEYEIESSLPLDAVESFVLKVPPEPPAATPRSPYAPLPPKKLRP